MTLVNGQYRICIHTDAPYLNPCQWGTATVVSTGVTSTVVALRLTKGGRFILRVHDLRQSLPQGESNRRRELAVAVADASGHLLPLPVVYDNGRVRDYGMVLPFGVPYRAVVTGPNVVLADEKGAALNSGGAAFQLADTPQGGTVGRGRGIRQKFRSPDATMIHVRVTGRR